MYDVIIIGAGIVGLAAARELSRYKLAILVLDRASDISCGATKANSGIIHAGYDCRPGTLKAKLNVRGAALFQTLAAELDIPYRNNGSMVLCFDENDRPRLQALYDSGIQNGVPKLRLITAAEAQALEPNVTPKVKAALWAETACIISPYEAAFALAENAAVNGVSFALGEAVVGIRYDRFFTVQTADGEAHNRVYQAKAVVNAAGLEADLINNCVNPQQQQLTPQRGQYYLIDNTHSDFVKRTLFQLPTAHGKGVLVAPTTHGNLLVGPNAENIDDKDDRATTPDGLREVLNAAQQSVTNLPIQDRITTFAGLRAKHASSDFVIDEPIPGFVNALGIDSPGLSAAPAIGEMITEILLNRLQPATKRDFVARREGIKHFAALTFSEQERLIQENPAFGHVVCRCETVTEAEIVEAIRRPVGARSLDGLKRRVRAQMGRCQGGFCTVKLVELLARELQIPEAAVTKSGGDTRVFIGANKMPEKD